MPGTYYVIKKNIYWSGLTTIPMYWWVLLPITYILLPIIVVFLPFFFEDIETIDRSEFLITIVFWLFFSIWWIYLLIETLKLKKVKNFKQNGWWIVKKVKVTSIGKLKANRGRWYRVDVYYIEAEDSGMIYYSNGYTKWKLLWTPITKLQLLYAEYWFTFDEKQSHKEDVLRKIDEAIAEKEYEVENSWLFSKITKGYKLWNLKTDRKTVEEWYVLPYWQVDNNKISVWDTVDVYIDPNNIEKYWVDIDFLFDENPIPISNPIHN